VEQIPETRGTPVVTGIRDQRHHWHPRISRTPRNSALTGRIFAAQFEQSDRRGECAASAQELPGSGSFWLLPITIVMYTSL
jgi:hypothetical protein